MDFKTNFHRICSERGTSPTALCKRMGLSTSKVNLWNNGSLPKQEMLVRLAKELDCSVMDFFSDEEAPHAVLDSDEREIISIYRKLNRRLKHEMIAATYEFEKRAKMLDDSPDSQSTVL